MNLIKCLNLNHKDNSAVVTVYCTDCGEQVGPNITPNPLCKEHHQEYKNFKHRFCPDCGIPLLNLKRGLNQDGRYAIRNGLHSRGDLDDIHDMIRTDLILRKNFDIEKNLEFIIELQFWGFHQTALVLKQLMIAT